MTIAQYPRGRRVIYSSAETVTAANVLEVLDAALSTHDKNANEIDYLYRYYKGEQPILSRIKEFRPEINNKIVENHALEIVDFKKGHIFGEPVQYVVRGERSGVSEQIAQLNEFMFTEDKAAKDKELAEWFFIAGTSYRLVLPDSFLGLKTDESPFEIATLDPRHSFVVYNYRFNKKPLMAVTRFIKENGDVVYSIYTPKTYFEIESSRFSGMHITKLENHVLNNIPIIEYPANMNRLGAFEVVLPLLDAINLVISNRLDGIEQFVQSFLKFVNCDIDDEKFLALRELGALLIKSSAGLPADVEIISEELDQTQTQVTKDDLYQAVLTICSIPDRQGGFKATSDTGTAVSLRDGWAAAEVSAKDIETVFKSADRKFLRLALNIVSTNIDKFNLSLQDISIKFTRNRTDNFLVKTQGLQGLLTSGVHPRIALATSGLFSDPEQVYVDSMEYLEKWKGSEGGIEPEGDFSIEEVINQL